jgi:hypothetical protein
MLEAFSTPSSSEAFEGHSQINYLSTAPDPKVDISLRLTLTSSMLKAIASAAQGHHAV